jgi:hypothetical protein
VALIGALATLMTTIGIVTTAMLSNAKDRKSAAALEAKESLRERLLLRDEQIEALEEDVAQKRAVIEQLVTLLRVSGMEREALELLSRQLAQEIEDERRAPRGGSDRGRMAPYSRRTP